MTANQLRYWDLQRQKKETAASTALAEEKAKTERETREQIISNTQLNKLKQLGQEYDNVMKSYDALKAIIEAGDYKLGEGDTFKVDLKSRQEWKDIKSALGAVGEALKIFKDIVSIGGLLGG